MSKIVKMRCEGDRTFQTKGDRYDKSVKLNVAIGSNKEKIAVMPIQ
ncbi:MAG: hypothetical protein JGK26_17915 [Microcoleus sp. PH2017_27_LUM_O_A]|nr:MULTISPECIES: hypothetical protein [unclassified Microcoleus]MCC3461786.1 hypothetical protein [Microcoleus sp. PH2017_11_PCY_U_A]MCC3480200.1 hypothetical protein [Microcoleus sp. PH2017_12_PCY_D_A]MCC3560976.1 hypothetical protein [Microcoleus sp. PH2017_27_LUM_O_A]